APDAAIITTEPYFLYVDGEDTGEIIEGNAAQFFPVFAAIRRLQNHPVASCESGPGIHKCHPVYFIRQGITPAGLCITVKPGYAAVVKTDAAHQHAGILRRKSQRFVGFPVWYLMKTPAEAVIFAAHQTSVYAAGIKQSIRALTNVIQNLTGIRNIYG